MISVIVHFSGSESWLILAKMSSKSFQGKLYLGIGTKDLLLKRGMGKKIYWYLGSSKRLRGISVGMWWLE